jgi:hypothetical protein
MKKVTKNSLALVLIATLATGCTKEENVEMLDADIPVVECYLVPGHDVVVQVSTMIPYDVDETAASAAIGGMQVSISTSDGTAHLLSEVNTGSYQIADSVINLVAGQQCTLEFTYNDELVVAETTIPLKPAEFGASVLTLALDRIEVGAAPAGPTATDPVEITWSNFANDYHIIVTEYIETDFDPINANMALDDPEEFRKNSTDPITGNAFNIDARSIQFFGTYRVILYKINQEYASLYEALSQSSQSLSAPLTNVQNGLGIFTGLNSDTLFIEVEEL